MLLSMNKDKYCISLSKLYKHIVIEQNHGTHISATKKIMKKTKPFLHPNCVRIAQFDLQKFHTQSAKLFLVATVLSPE
jgi:hypothetical protein